MDVEPLTVREREQLTVRSTDATHGKRLDPSLVARLASAPQTGIPGYLLQLSRNSYPRRPRYFNSGWTTIARIQCLRALRKDSGTHEHDYERERPGLVRDSMSYLWAARRGLSESELLIGLELSATTTTTGIMVTVLHCR